MKKIGGVVLMIAAAVNFFFNVTDYYTLAAITLPIVEFLLVAATRRAQA